MIDGKRVRQVREFRGWTQTELAEKLSVTQGFVAKVENGSANAPEPFIIALVFQSGFSTAFFQRPAESDFPLGSLLFRSRAGMTEREQKSVHRHASMAYELVQRMLRKPSVKTVPVRVPRCRTGDPEEAAALARSELGLSPDTPVNHVIHTMETAGVIVVTLPREFRKGDAFSAWVLTHDNQRRPIVVLSSGRPADRVRMSAAHELGHLVMHHPAQGARAVIEAQAKRFAAAFLLPADVMRQEMVGPFTLDMFLQLKTEWKVAVQALIVRAYHLELITQRQYRTLFQRLSARGWKTHEPLSTRIPLERPRAIRQIAELLYGRQLNYAKLSQDVGYPETFVRELMECHAARNGRSDQSIAAPNPTTGPGALLAFKRTT